VKRLERQVVTASDVLVTLTEADADRFRELARTPPVVLPPGYAPAVPRAAASCGPRPRRVVVVGSFDWHVKEANLRAFLEVADPLFAADAAEIRVVGRLSPDLAAQAGQWRATTFTGRVDDIGAELARARLGVIAELTGGGFKMKALDYVFHGVPVAMLAGSANGLPLEDGRSVLSYASIDDLARGVLAVLDDETRLARLAGAALDACSGRFDWEARGRALRAAIDDHE
jgi:glycosyltransferase involved in cell wall biosynthesis